MKDLKVGVSCNFAIEGIDLDKKSIPVILSNETEVVRYNYEDGKYFLTLLHDAENVDLERKDILSLFINHNTYELPIGKFENVRLEDKKLKANAVFDESDDESMKIFNKLQKGFLQSFSVGISIHEKVLSKDIDGIKYYDVTKWSISEASVVGIPAIPTAKVGLNEEIDGVNRTQALAENQNLNKRNVMTNEELQALKDNHAEALKSEGLNATNLERERVGGIMALSGDDVAKQKAIVDGLSIGDTAIALNKSNAEAHTSKKLDFEKAAEDVADLESADSIEMSADDEAWAKAEAKVYGGSK